MAPLFSFKKAPVTFGMAPFISDMASSLLDAPSQLSTNCVAKSLANTTFNKTSLVTYINLSSYPIHNDKAKHFSNLATMAMIFSILTLILVCAIFYCCVTVSTALERFVSATFQSDLQGSLKTLTPVENLYTMCLAVIQSKLGENGARRLQISEPLPSIQVPPSAYQIERPMIQEWDKLLPPPYIPYLT